MAAGAVTLRADATANQYNISYTLNGGSHTSCATGANPATGTYDTDVRICNPTKTGYTFSGWTSTTVGSHAKRGTSANPTTTWDGTSTTDTYFRNLVDSGEVTMVANWTANTNTAYKVHHYTKDLGATTYTLNETQNLTGTTGAELTLANLKKTITGFTYDKGYLTGGTQRPTSGDVTTTTILADGSREIYLYYTRNTYALTLNNGTGVSGTTGAGTYEYGASVAINATVKDGYTWSTWTKTAGTTPSTFAAGTKSQTIVMAAGAVTLRADATANQYNINYTLNGGSASNPTSAFYDTDVQIANPIRDGYTFSGWTSTTVGSHAKRGTSPNPTTTWTGTSTTDTYFRNLVDTGAVTMVANWTANTYEVKYNNDCDLVSGGTMSNSSHTYGTAKNLTANAYTCNATVTYNYHGATGGNSTSSATATGTFLGWTVGAPNLLRSYNVVTNANTTINSDGTLTAAKDNTSGTSVAYANYFYNLSSDAVENTPYVYIIDLKQKNVSGGTATFNIASTQGSNISQINNNAQTLNNLPVGLTHVNTTSPSSFTNAAWLARGFVTVPKSVNASVTFRPILIAGTYTDTDLYYYNQASVLNLATSGVVNVYTDWTEPTVTLTTPTKTGYSFSGWYTAATGGTKVGDGGATYRPTANTTLHAQYTINNPATPTITGGTTKVYGSSATTLTCSTSTSYSADTTKYYSFGYATTDGGTPSNWTTASDSNTLTISATEYVGQRWYSCRVYAMNNDNNSIVTSTVSSATTADTEMTINNAQLTFKKGTCTTPSSDVTLYTRQGATGVYAQSNGIRNNSATFDGTIPTASKTGYVFNGWYSGTSGGTKVLNANGSFTGSVVTNYTTASAWDVTANQTLHAECSAAQYNISYTLNGGSHTSCATGANPATGTYDTDVRICNPTKSGHTFSGWTSTTVGSNAKSGNSASPTTAWTGTSTKNTYFRNLIDTNNGTVTMVANWTANTVTLKLKNGSNLTTTGYSVSLSSSDSTDTAPSGYSSNTATNSTGTVTFSAVPNGTYYVWAGKNSNATGTRIYTGKTITVSDNSPGSEADEIIQYYELTLTKGTGISAVSNAGTSTTSAVQHLYKSSGTQQDIAIDATVSNGYTWSTWAKTSGTTLATINLTTKDQNIKMGAGAATYTANAEANPYTLTVNANGGTLPATNDWTDYEINTNSLPNTYKELEFIEGTGTQYINTGYKPKAATGIEVEYMFTDLLYQQRTYGVENSNSIFYSMYINGSGKWAYAYKDSSGNWVNTGTSVNMNKHTFKFNVTSGYFSIDTGSNTAMSGSVTKTSATNMLIFGMNSNTSSGVTFSRGAKLKLYSFKIYESGTLIKHYVPCYKVSDGTVGLYEKLGGEFLSSASGSFIRGMTTETKEVTYNAAYGTLPTPTRRGYTFAGWNTQSNGSGSTITAESIYSTVGDQTLYAKWSDPTAPANAAISSTNNVATKQTATLTCTDNVGVTKYYWGTSAPTGSSSYTTVLSTTSMSITKDVTAGGTYYLACKDAAGNTSSSVSKTFYKTTLNMTNGTVSPASVITMSGNSFNLPTPTASTGYTTNGNWYTDSGMTSGAKAYGSSYTPGSSTTLYSGASLTDYTITYKDCGGGNFSGTHANEYPAIYNYGTGATLDSPTKNGYVFNGYYTASACTGDVQTSIPTTATGNKTFYAKWTANTATVTIKKDGSNWTSSNPGINVALYQSGTSKQAYSVATVSTNKETVTWTSGTNNVTLLPGTYNIYISKDANHLTTLVDSGETLEVTASPSQSVNMYTLTVGLSHTTATVNGESITNNGTVVVAKTATNVHSIVATANTGYEFASGATVWTKTGTISFTSATSASTTAKVESTGTITATATPETYTLTINPDGGAYNGVTGNTTITQDYGTTYQVLNNPTKTGYVFNGWTLQSGSSGTFNNYDSSVSTNNVTPYNYNSASSTLPAVYNNKSGSTAVTRSMVTDSTATGGYSLQIVTNGEANPGTGGIYVTGYTTNPSEIDVVQIRAKIPTNYTLTLGGLTANYAGIGVGQKYDTRSGTGEWVTYDLVVYRGDTGSFSGTVYIYLTPGSGASATSVTWNIDYINIKRYTRAQFKSLYTFGAGNGTLKANWSAGGSRVTFDNNGGSWDTDHVKNWTTDNYNLVTATTATRDLRYNTSYATHPGANDYNWIPDDRVTLRTGFTFNGWWTAQSGGTQIFNTDGTLKPSISGISNASSVWIKYDENYTVYAHWTDVTAPTAALETTSTVPSTTQTATLTCQDNDKVASYYWGTNSSPSDSAYTNITPAPTYTTTKTINAAGTYYLICKDAAGLPSDPVQSVTIYSYSVDNRLLTLTGTKNTLKAANYTTATDYSTSGDPKCPSSAPCLAPSGTSITRTSIYSVPTGSNTSYYAGMSVGAASSTAATVLSSDPTLSANNTIYTTWWNRIVYSVSLNAGTGGSIKATTEFNTSGVTVASGSSGTISARYGATITLTNTPATGYDFASWSATNTTITSSHTDPITSSGVSITGTFSPKTITCAAGKYLPANSTSCSNCTAGNWCPGGDYTFGSSASGLNACSDLGTGYTSAGGVNDTANTRCYLPVDAGKYKTSATGTSVASCDNGKFSVAHNSYYNSTDTSACTNCAKGSISKSDRTGCTACQASGATGTNGTTSAAGATSCNTGCGKTNAATWTTATWNANDNTVSNSCTIATCITGYEVSSNSCSPITYTISYTLNGGSASNPTTASYDTDVQIANPTKTGYTFAGWTSTTLGPNAKRGTSANPTTAWDGSSTTDTYFRNLTDSSSVTLVANWTYIATPTINKTDYNTFTYSATGAASYNITTTNTQPAANASGWTSSTSKDVSAAGTYYVWAKDSAGNVSPNSANINAYSITRSATNATLTTRYDSTSSSTGTNYTTTPLVVLHNTNIWAKCEAAAGYGNPTLKHGSTNMTASGSYYPVTASEAITCTATPYNYKNIDANTYYYDLNSAIDEIDAGETIQVLNDTTETENVIIDVSAITIDLNGHTIDLGAHHIEIIGNIEDVVIENTVGTGTITGSDYFTIQNAGEIELYAEDYEMIITNTSSSPSAATIYNTNSLAVFLDVLVSGKTGIYNEGDAYTIGEVTGTVVGIENNGGTIEVNGNVTGISNSSGTIAILSGIISNPTNVTAAITNSSGATLTLGYNSNAVSTTVPEINCTASSGTCYGINNSGTLNFYDGVVTSNRGTNNAIYGSVTNTPSGYSVNKTVSSGTETAKLLYNATPTINKTDYNTFTYSAPGAVSYNVTTTSTKPAANASGWTTTTSKDVSAAGTYYVWAKDKEGVVSANSTNIKAYSITRSATNATLTTRRDSTSSSSGTNYTTTPLVVLHNTNIWAKCEASSGYSNATLKHGSTNMTASGSYYAVTASEAITCTAELLRYKNTSTNTNYQTLYEALNAVASNQTIQVLGAEIDESGSTAPVLASGKTGVKIDLYGHVIILGENPLTNNGTLEIYSSSGTGIIVGYNTNNDESVIINNGTLTTNNTATNFVAIINEVKDVVNNTDGIVILNNENATLSLNPGTDIASVSGDYYYNYNIKNYGTLNINDALIEDGFAGNNISPNNKTFGIMNYETGITNITTVTINTPSQAIQNLGTLTISDGDINGNIYNRGTATIIDGEITATGIGIQNLGILTLGNSGNSVSTTAPVITSTGSSNASYGIINLNGIFNYYDGVISSAAGTGHAINGAVSDTPAGYYPQKVLSGSTETATLVSANYANIDTMTGYSSLSTAFSEVANNQTIRVIAASVSESATSLPANKTGIKLDLNGHTINMSSNSITIPDDSELEIYSSVDNGKITGNRTTQNTGVIINNGTLVTSETSSNTLSLMSSAGAGYSNARVIYASAGSSTTLNRGTNIEITTNASSTRYLIHNAGTLTIDGASLTGYPTSATSNNRGINNAQGGKVIMDSGNINVSGFGIYNASTVTNAITVSGNSSITSTKATGISVTSGSLIVNNGTIKGYQSGITASSGSATVKAGQVIGQTQHGMYVSGSGTITVGDNSNAVNNNTPVIMSQTTSTNEYYGVNNPSGTFNFYDGIIISSKGSGYAINSATINKPSGYEVEYEVQSNGEEHATLLTQQVINIYTSDQPWSNSGMKIYLSTSSTDKGNNFKTATTGSSVTFSNVTFGQTYYIWASIGAHEPNTIEYTGISFTAQANTSKTITYFITTFGSDNNISNIKVDNTTGSVSSGISFPILNGHVSPLQVTPASGYLVLNTTITIGGSSNIVSGYPTSFTTGAPGNATYAFTSQAISYNYTVIKTNNSTTGYSTLYSAMQAVDNNETIRVNKDVNETSQTAPVLKTGKTGVKLNLNGRTITLGTKTITIPETSGLDIYSSVDGGVITGSNAANSSGMIINNGTLTTNNTLTNYITLRNTASNTSNNARVIYNSATGVLTLNSHTKLEFSTSMSNNTDRYLITNNGGSICINGAELENNPTSTNTHNNGIYNNGDYSYVETNNAFISVSGIGIFNETESGNIEINIYGGTIKSINSAIEMHATDVTIIEGDARIISQSAAAIYSAGVLSIYDEGTTITGYSYGIIMGGNSTATTNIYSGTITGKTEDAISIGGTYSTVNIGSSSNGFNSTMPIIISESTSTDDYGIAVGAPSTYHNTLNFYDGKIISKAGTGHAIDYNVTGKPSGYIEYKYTNDGAEIATLKPTVTMPDATDITNGTNTGASTGTYLNTPIARNQIKHIVFVDSVSDFTGSGQYVNATVQMATGIYAALIMANDKTLYIAQNGGVALPADSSSLFYNLINLESIEFSSGTISKSNYITNTANMFYGCSRLNLIKSNTTNYAFNINMTNVANASNMFYGNSSLQTLAMTSSDYFLLSNITSMFHNATNLNTLTLTENRIVDVKLTSVENAFNGVMNLTTLNGNAIERFNINSVPSASSINMFDGAWSLSDESLNNILGIAGNSSDYAGTKTFSNFGNLFNSSAMSPYSASRIQGLSNYDKFTAAGWTTGY